MEKHIERNILTVYDLKNKADRDHFAGVLDALADNSDWHLFATRPDLWAAEGDLGPADGTFTDNGMPDDLPF